METFILRPKRDRRAQPRLSPPDVANHALEPSRQGGEPGGDAVPASTEDGDFVIRVEERDGVFLYVVTAAPGADEFQSLTAEQAVTRALACAKRQRTRAWFKGDTAPVLLEDFRETQRFRIDFS